MGPTATAYSDSSRTADPMAFASMRANAGSTTTASTAAEPRATLGGLMRSARGMATLKATT